MSPMYFNTLGETGEELEQSQAHTEHQEAVILGFFKSHRGRRFTPFEVRSIINWHAKPITSVRRAMTNLTSRGFLVKTAEMRMEQLGKPNHTWMMAAHAINEINEYLGEMRKGRKPANNLLDFFDDYPSRAPRGAQEMDNGGLKEEVHNEQDRI